MQTVLKVGAGYKLFSAPIHLTMKKFQIGQEGNQSINFRRKHLESESDSVADVVISKTSVCKFNGIFENLPNVGKYLWKMFIEDR